MRRLVVTLLALALPLSCGGRSQESEGSCRPNARVAPPLACTPENLARCPFSAVDE